MRSHTNTYLKHHPHLAFENIQLISLIKYLDFNTIYDYSYVVLGDISTAATNLRRSNLPEGLNLAAELAKSAGLNTFADYIETKVKKAEKEQTQDQETEELLAELPTKMELLMKKNKGQIEETKIENVKDGDHDSFTGETAHEKITKE